MRVDPNSHVPVFQQIVDEVHAAIARGVFRAGEALPSVRVLALELGVNPNTVQRAFEALERSGVIESRRGVGMFVRRKGRQSAVEHAEAAVEAAFRGGIRLATAASMSPVKTRDVFERTLKDAKDATNDHQPAR